MSGARMTMSLLSIGAATLRFRSASPTVFDSNAPRFQSASASAGRSNPAAIAAATTPPAPTPLRAALRERSVIRSLSSSGHSLGRVAYLKTCGEFKPADWTRDRDLDRKSVV